LFFHGSSFEVVNLSKTKCREKFSKAIEEQAIKSWRGVNKRKGDHFLQQLTVGSL